MRAGLVALLRAQSSISAIVGTSGVYITKAPQTAKLPFVVIDQSDTDEFNSLDGTGRLRRMGFTIDSIASTSLGAQTLNDVIREFIDDYTGAAGSLSIQAVIVNGEHGGYDPPNDGSDGGFHMVSLDVDIFYQRA